MKRLVLAIGLTLFGSLTACSPGLQLPPCGCSAVSPRFQASADSAVKNEAKGQVTPPEQAGIPLSGNLYVHDPVLTHEADTYYVFSTGRGISVHTSKDGRSWQQAAPIFRQGPVWTEETIPGSRSFYWAPDISFYNGLWHLYYSVSTFGKRRSAIGLATNVTLDSSKPGYQWKDEGAAFESHESDDFNAIDPNLFADTDGQTWLTFGSFWSGIKLIKIDRQSGKPPKGAPLYSLARRPNTDPIRGSIEAPFLVRRGKFYYLFVSFDFCCRGVNSTYNIRVGRSEAVTGPYVDREGKSMLEGGGTLVRAGYGRWHGPGHNAVYRNGDKDWLVYHAYDAEENGASKLRIEEMQWDAAGWPLVSGG